MVDMTIEQALHCLKAEYDAINYCCNCKLRDICNRFNDKAETDYALIAYKRGAKSLEKTMLKKVYIEEDKVLCPTCGCHLDEHKYGLCLICGQKLDWGDEDE